VKTNKNVLTRSLAVFALTSLLILAPVKAQNSNFHNAPEAAKQLKNPYEGQRGAAEAGRKLYASNCASCHGKQAEGTGNIPPLVGKAIQSAAPGELFWFITRGDADDGMPAWSSLPKQQRWQIVTYLKSLGPSSRAHAQAAHAIGAAGAQMTGAPPQAPFTDYRFEKPGTIRKITVQDLPAPYATNSSSNGPEIVPRPEGAWPKVPAGFKVEQYAIGLDNPRLIRTAPTATSSRRRAVPAGSGSFAESRATASRSRFKFSLPA